MDGVSIAASIVGIASAGVQVSIKLVTLATQISTASDRVSAIGNDISLTSGVLHQLGELMTQKNTDDGISIFSQGGLESTRASAAACERIFHQVEIEAKKASEQLRGCKQGRLTGGKIKLSRAEKAKWPFLQPSVDTLRVDLREAKGTLMLMLQVTSLALSKRMADLSESTSSSMSEQRDFIRAILSMHQQQQQEQRLEIRGGKPNGILTGPQEVTSATDSPRLGTADGTASVHVVQPILNPATSVNASQPRALPAQARPSLYKPAAFTMAMSSGQDMTVNLPTLSGQDPSRDIRTSSVSRGSFKASEASSHTIDNENNHRRPNSFSSVGTSARSVSDHSGDGISTPKIDTELNLFLLKPVVKDFFDKIELSWSVQNTRMQPLAIRKYMANHEQEGIPSVIEMLHNLHAYEQAMVDLEISKYPEGSVLSLRRTKTDIQHRDMTFNAIPGLQFVVQHVIRSYANPVTASTYIFAPGDQRAMAQAPASGMNQYSSYAQQQPPPLQPGPGDHAQSPGYGQYGYPNSITSSSGPGHPVSSRMGEQMNSGLLPLPAVGAGGPTQHTYVGVPTGLVLDQSTAFPMAGCQNCGTNVSPVLGEGGYLICNTCGHHFRKQQQLQGQQQQHQQQDLVALSALQKYQHHSTQHYYSHMSNRPATTYPQSPLQPQGAVWPQVQIRPDHVAAAAAAAAAVQQQQQQMQMQVAPQQRQQQMQMQMNRQAQVAAQQQQTQTQQQALAAPQRREMQFPLNPTGATQAANVREGSQQSWRPRAGIRRAPGIPTQGAVLLRSANPVLARSTKRPRWDDHEAVNEVAKTRVTGSPRYREPSPAWTALSLSAWDSEESDFDGREGDDVDVDVDAIVKKLLEKYTTLFD